MCVTWPRLAPSLSSSPPDVGIQTKCPPRVPITAPIADAPLHCMSAHPPCRSAAAPSHHLPLRARIAPRGARNKRRPLPFILFAPPPPPPTSTLVSCHRHAPPQFLPRHRCRAASSAVRPRVQVPELLPTSVTPPQPPPASMRLCSSED
jgi:hypothetical protein